jgi:3',5'-cyclic-AMP phosphodiesterase
MRRISQYVSGRQNHSPTPHCDLQGGHVKPLQTRPKGLTVLICQLTDLHVRPKGLPCNRVSETNMLTERACRAVAAFTPQPDLVIITGDLSESGLESEYANLSAILGRTLRLPVYVVPGNHDRRDTLRATLAHLPGVTADPTFVQYAIEDWPVRIVMLDTLAPGEAHGILTAAQLDWLEKTLAAQPQKPTLIGMHHPPIATGLSHMDHIALSNRDAFRTLIARHRQVTHIVCGHHHRSIVGQCAQATVVIAPSATHQVELTFQPDDSGAFNFEPASFQLHAWLGDDRFAAHTVYVERFPGPFPFIADTEKAGA